MTWTPTASNSTEKKKSEKLTSIKSIILFQIKISVNPYGYRDTFEIEKDIYSNTVISIVHSNQEVDALLVLFWDDYFRINKKEFLTSGRFECKESVTNQELIDAISNHFLKQTSRTLTASNQDFLHRKLFTLSVNGLVTLHSFSKSFMVDSQYSFGQWIFYIIKLLKVEGTIGMWKNGLIDGFIPKDSNVYLLNAANGTFTLRFSERNPTIGVVVKNGCTNDSWSPFSIGECRSRSLPERLMDYDELCFLRNANGDIYNKHECLVKFIKDDIPDHGYTSRGKRLSNYLETSMYMDSDPFVGPSPVFGDLSSK